jgi:hypothetical protein
MASSLSTPASMSAPLSPQLHASPPFAVVCVSVEFYLCLVCMQARRGEDLNFDAVSKPLEYKLGNVVILVAQPLHDLFAQFLWVISMRCPYEVRRALCVQGLELMIFLYSISRSQRNALSSRG